MRSALCSFPSPDLISDLEFLSNLHQQTDGPYYVAGELIRQNNTDGSAGIPMVMDIGVLDIETCLPIENA